MLSRHTANYGCSYQRLESNYALLLGPPGSLENEDLVMGAQDSTSAFHAIKPYSYVFGDSAPQLNASSALDDPDGPLQLSTRVAHDNDDAKSAIGAAPVPMDSMDANGSLDDAG